MVFLLLHYLRASFTQTIGEGIPLISRKNHVFHADNLARYGYLALSLLFSLWFFPWSSLLPSTPPPGNPPAESKAEEKNRRDPREQYIVIDPGHGGLDSGCTAGGVEEKHLTLALAEQLREELEARGYRVLLTRRSDFLMPLEERAAAGNQRHIFLLICLHINYLKESPGANGMENWYNGQVNPRSEALARLILDEACEATGARNRGLRREDNRFRVIRRTKVPSCLLECGFLSNRRERERLVSLEYQQLLVKGIANGIDRFYEATVSGDFT